MDKRFKQTLLRAAAQPYRRAGRFAWYFAQGKLGGDPVFARILSEKMIPDHARITDLGCGQGLLASWLFAADSLAEQGSWPDNLPRPPRATRLRGIELMAPDVRRAREALNGRAEFVCGNMCTEDFGEADVIVILDVLHYVDYAAQDDVLLRAKAALGSRGRLLLRVGDAAAGLPFRISNWADAVITFSRGHRLSRLYCRTLNDWMDILKKIGFTVRAAPMSQGTPFANVLLIADIG